MIRTWNNTMRLFIDNMAKGTGKTGKPIKGQWNAAKKRYDYPKKPSNAQHKIVIAEDGPIDPRAKLNKYTAKPKTSNEPKYFKDVFGQIRSTHAGYKQAQEVGTDIHLYRTRLALLSPDAQRQAMSEPMKQLIVKLESAHGDKDTVLAPKHYSRAKVAKLRRKQKAAKQDAHAKPLTAKERQFLMEVNIFEERQAILDNRKKGQVKEITKKSLQANRLYIVL